MVNAKNATANISGDIIKVLSKAGILVLSCAMTGVGEMLKQQGEALRKIADKM